MKTRVDARIWVYRDAVAASLRKHRDDRKFLPQGLTPAGVKRVQAEMDKLATWLEGKATKLEGKRGIPCGNTRELDNVMSGQS